MLLRPKNKIMFVLVLIVAIVCCVPSVREIIAPKAYAVSKYSQLQQRSKEIDKELDKLKKDKASQQAIKSKLEEKIKNTQDKINTCNEKLRKYSDEISECQSRIAEKERELADSKMLFRKRMRSIYMSGNTSGELIVLLNSESVSDYLALAQLSVNVSNRDKKLMDTIIGAAKEIEANKKQIEAQKASEQKTRSELKSEQESLNSQSDEIAAVIEKLDANSKQLSDEQHTLQADMSVILADIKSRSESQNKGGSGSNGNSAPASNTVYEGDLMWPVPSCRTLSSGWGQRWGRQHKGIDISGGGISGKPIIAVGDGVVKKANNSCPHNFGKKGWNCGCGGGYGNFVYLSVKAASGTDYTLVYGHMSQCIVSTGQSVKAGQVIGYVGSTGWSEGWHLHYEVWVNGKNINPMSVYK